MSENAEHRRQAECFRPVYSPPGRYVNDHCFVDAEDRTRGLFLASLDWSGSIPTVVPFMSVP